MIIFTTDKDQTVTPNLRTKIFQASTATNAVFET